MSEFLGVLRYSKNDSVHLSGNLLRSSVSDVAQYFTSELDIQTKIRQVKDELKSWRNGIIVVQKLISEMNNEQQAGTWQSLLKFVHHFLELKNTEGNGAPRGCMCLSFTFWVVWLFENQFTYSTV